MQAIKTPEELRQEHFEEVEALGFESIEAYELHQKWLVQFNATQDRMAAEFLSTYLT